MAINKKIHRLICYDIACPKRLARVHRLVSQQALCIQYSVYYWHASQRELSLLLKALEARMDPREDDIRIYPLPKKPHMVQLGRSRLPEGLQLFNEKALQDLWR